MHKNAIDVKPGGVVRLYFGFDTKSGPQCQLRACMHDTKWRPGEASNGRTGGGWGGGIDLSPMDMATQASRLSCIYIRLAIPDPAKLRTTQHLK